MSAWLKSDIRRRTLHVVLVGLRAGESARLGVSATEAPVRPYAQNIATPRDDAAH